MDEENITGYHGTIKEAAKNIIETQKIDNSIGDEEWLGRGKYFYDRYTNAIEYNMKKYNENKNINELISYNNLIINYAILETTIKCAKEDILNLDEIIILSKFVWAWEKIYNKVKENPNFQKLKYRDGYIIDYMINEIPGCKYKVVVKTFDRITKEFKNRRKDNIVFDSTRIIYEIKQKYICVQDESVIKKIKENNKNFQKEYNAIERLIKIVNKGEYYEI